MDDVIVAYGQNGEPVRPHQGYPLRLVVPGFQGKYHVKWLRRLRLVKRPLMSYWEKHHFLDRGYRPGGEPRTSDFGGDAGRVSRILGHVRRSARERHSTLEGD
ncbi:MAG: molybdopterin-dependent oxidoreductase [Acidobacteria bacterium]|nr:molybdopterin-dependent oxidoreductase [Chloroflexota bacterium]MYN67431.1 molybdopterin-dependent oxidoreductase [Acidobacteriota bacterium]